MSQSPPISTRTATLLPYATLFLSARRSRSAHSRHSRRIGRSAGGGSARRLILYPHRHHRRGDQVADDVEHGAAHVEEAIDAEHQPDAFGRNADRGERSEEHTSELQSLMRNSYAVFCLKKKK